MSTSFPRWCEAWRGEPTSTPERRPPGGDHGAAGVADELDHVAAAELVPEDRAGQVVAVDQRVVGERELHQAHAIARAGGPLDERRAGDLERGPGELVVSADPDPEGALLAAVEHREDAQPGARVGEPELDRRLAVPAVDRHHDPADRLVEGELEGGVLARQGLDPVDRLAAGRDVHLVVAIGERLLARLGPVRRDPLAGGRDRGVRPLLHLGARVRAVADAATDRPATARAQEREEKERPAGWLEHRPRPGLQTRRQQAWSDLSQGCPAAIRVDG
jgi:hypothetical protein